MIPKAATVLVVRDAPNLEVFMVRRASTNAFMPDAYVYPGGRVDAQDSAIGDDPIAVAAIRETFEEAAVLLAKNLSEDAPLEPWRSAVNSGRSFAELVKTEELDLDLERLLFFAHWITPEAESRRYDTYFYIAVAPTSQVAMADDYEVTDGVWISPKDALERHRSGSFLLFPPTFQTLDTLCQFDDVASLQAWATGRQPPAILPYFLPDAEQPTIVMAGDPDYPDTGPYQNYPDLELDAQRLSLIDGAWTKLRRNHG